MSEEEARSWIEVRGISHEEVDQCWHCHQSGCEQCHNQGYVPESVTLEELYGA